MTLSRLLFDAAIADGDRMAIYDQDRTWTFGEADCDAGRLAAVLRECGVASGDRVGVHLHKCAEGFIAMHAVVRAGAVAVPLDPGSPPERLARICDHLSVQVVVTHEPRSAAVARVAAITDVTTVIGLGHEIDGVRTLSPGDVLEREPVDPVEVDLDDPAYVITTSGSTGEPKGIVHSHRSALAYAVQVGADSEITAEDRVADIAPHHFDISTLATWSAPLHSAAIVVVPEPHQRLPASHAALLADQRVTIWYSVPFLLQQLVLRGNLSSLDFGSLRRVHFGGEVIPSSVVADAMRLLPAAVFANIYGPAEVNHCSTHELREPPDPDTDIPIGRPWAAAEFRLAEPGAAAPDGAEIGRGEIWVAASTMMTSYFGRSAAESGIVVVDGRRWYRTGDIATRDDDGVYTFVGRTDHQVKVRGHRIELEGVEVALEELDHVTSVVATVLRDDPSGDRVVAGVVEPGDGFDPDEFVRSARSRLPAHAAPTQVVILNGATTTGSGKLDRRMLRVQTLERARDTGELGQ